MARLLLIITASATFYACSYVHIADQAYLALQP